MKFDDLWPHLEHLPESEVASIYLAAASDKTYRLQLVGLFAVCLCALAAYSFAIPAFYRLYHPNLLAKLSVAGLTFLGIWLGYKLLDRLNRGLYHSAVMRQISARGN